MTDPKRWSSPSSEVDPVLRSVLRYARELEPSASETQSLLRRMQAAEHARAVAAQVRFRRPARPVGAKAIVLSAAFGAALGSVAFAGYAVHQARSHAATRVLAPTSSQVKPSRPPLGGRLPALAPSRKLPPHSPSR